MLLRKNSRTFGLIWNWRMFQSTSDAQEALLAGVRVQGSKVTAAMYLLSCGQPAQVFGVGLSLDPLNPEFFSPYELFNR